MKRIVIHILFFIGAAGLWQSCIKDQSVGIVRELSEIDIRVAQDTFYVDFGKEVIIPATVTQTGDLNLTYEWRAGWINPTNGKVKDSLKIVSKEKELHYIFTALGEFQVRLQVTNEDGSSFHYFTVFVRTSFQQGLLVLSEDKNRLGRSSFLRVKEPKEIITSDEKFVLHAFEGLNKDKPLNKVKDLTWVGKYIYLLAEDGKMIHVYNKETFDYMNSIYVDQEAPGLTLQQFCLGNPPYGFPTLLVLTEEGDTRIADFDMQLILPDDKSFPGERFDKLYTQSSVETNYLFVNFEESYIAHALGFLFPSPRYSSENYFQGKHIVNLMADADNQLHVIATDPQDEQMVTITTFANMNTELGFLVYSGAFTNPKDYSYRSEQPLTLTRETEMLTNNKFHECFYARGKELYLWIYRGENARLPEVPMNLNLDGEITCMFMSPDENYLYLGIWNPAAKEELKGSVYIMDMKTHTIIRQYRGIADKPMKIMYKD